MPLTPGQTLSFYEILGPLGAGAMGEVYRAKDARLDREVAIKVLPRHFVESKERLRRFEREAKSLARLNHSNVAQIHSVDQVEDTSFIVLEFVPGETLEERITRGTLPLQESIDVCRQIAEGLEAAHEAGVIHRDLKPANVRITPECKVKVLDFGLAKQAWEGEVGATTGSLLNTEEGRLLGTPTYMAPEQARGKPIDKRVDVWAFGCVLYECLTRRRPFQGETLGDVLASVLEKQPDWSQLPAGTPSRVRQLLERCLDKNSHTRLRDIGEARIALDRAGEESQEIPTESRRRGIPFGAAALSVVVALGLGAVFARIGFDRSSPLVIPQIRQQRLTEMVGLEETPAVSPGGGKVVFVSRVNGKRHIFVRLLATGSWKQLTHREADHSFPRWVDENTLIYFVHSEDAGHPGSLWTTDYLGSSPPKLLLESAQGEADVDHSGQRIAMFRSDAEGPALVVLDYARPENETRHRLPVWQYGSPRWSPNDRHIAFEVRIGLKKGEIRVFDLDARKMKTVTRVAGQTRGLAWMPDGSGLVFASSEGSTLAYPPIFSLRAVDIEGDRNVPLPCEGTGYASYVEPDVTSDGKLVVSRVAVESDIFRYPVDGAPLENVKNAKRVTRQTGLVQVPSASPRGEEVAYLSDSGGHANVWVARVDGSEPRKITDEQDPDTIIGLPLWSPRGDWITYWKGPPGRSAEQWLIRPDGTGEHRLVEVWGGASWSQDGEWLYYIAPAYHAGKPSVERIPVPGGRGQPEPVRDGAAGITVTSDGSTGYFSPSDLRQGEIWKVTPGETGIPELLVEGLQSRIPLWPHHYALSPDELWLAAPLRDEGTTNLWRISTEDGTLEPITDFQQRATIIGRQVSWSRDEDGEYVFAALMEMDADIVLLEGLFGRTTAAFPPSP